ncbi:MAG: hypothetical protein AAF989_02965 [Planctomycetota bacterium]
MTTDSDWGFECVCRKSYLVGTSIRVALADVIRELMASMGP